MPKKPLKKKEKKEEIPDWKIQILRDGCYPAESTFAALHFYYSDRNHDSKKELYERIRNDFLKDWISKNPGSRPWSWFAYDAPRQVDDDFGCFWHGTLPVERVHIKGGTQLKFRHGRMMTVKRPLSWVAFALFSKKKPMRLTSQESNSLDWI